MHERVRILALLPVLALVACGGGGTDDSGPQSAALAREIVLGYGETAHVDALSLQFSELVDDSRCPTDGRANCVWEGNGSIIVSATNGELAQMLNLNTNPKFATTAIFAGHLIQLRRLDPHPTSDGRADPEDYSATLSVDGLSPAGG